ncbi:MAG: aminotransferase class V-fold PLP-dependent enzyme [Gemmatimonadales bacterium]|nr:aminotransferase class V-fold PLP-dependent enzyme [Gemmatimonadales bacterium]
MPPRRQLLRAAALLGAAALTPRHGAQATVPPLPPPPPGPPTDVATDEAYWRGIARQFGVTDRVTNLEAGFFGLMPRPVLEAYHRHIDRVNREGAWFARREYPRLAEAARAGVAGFLGVAPEEVALTRGATEALQALIGQYRGVGPGDTVMVADLDYDAMIDAMGGLAARAGATVARVRLPEPGDADAVLAAYTAALEAHPRTKLLLLTHCSNKTGLILPVAAIAAAARARGADVVVDAAHSFGQVPLSVADLDAELVGLNLHKWVGAPVGAGVMVIRRGALGRIGVAHGDTSAPADRIESRIHTGTTHFATVMAIPDALAFQAAIGVERKAARLRYLRDRWVAAVRGVPGVDILTPDAPGMVGAITSFRLHGRGDRAANQAVAKALLDEFGVFTVWRSGPAGGDCVRVTPALHSGPADCDRLAAALRTLAARG